MLRLFYAFNLPTKLQLIDIYLNFIGSLQLLLAALATVAMEFFFSPLCEILGHVKNKVS